MFVKRKVCPKPIIKSYDKCLMKPKITAKRHVDFQQKSTISDTI